MAGARRGLAAALALLALAAAAPAAAQLGDLYGRAWLRVDAPASWDSTQTTRVVRRLFSMFHLSVDGLSEAVAALVGARKAA